MDRQKRIKKISENLNFLIDIESYLGYNPKCKEQQDKGGIYGREKYNAERDHIFRPLPDG